MRKLFWAVIIFMAYVWVMSSGHEKMVIRQGKYLYNILVSWFDDAEVDFQVQNNNLEKVSKEQQEEQVQRKKTRRWD